MRAFARIRDYKYSWIFLAFFLVYLAVPVILGENSVITVHDNLDSEVAYNVVLANSHKAFDLDPSSKIDQIMNGLPRGCLPSGLNAVTWLFLAFKPFMAYLINYLLVHVIAFAGMFLLLERHILPKDEDPAVILAASLCFAILPFYTIFGLSIAGQPLLLYSFLNILKNDHELTDLLIIFSFPFYSTFELTGVFIVIALALILAGNTIMTRKFNVIFFWGIIGLTFLYAISDITLIRLIFFDRAFISHRILLAPDRFTAIQALLNAFDNFLQGQYHAASLHGTIILPSALLALLINYFKKSRDKLLLLLLSAAALISLWYGLFGWRGYAYFSEKITLLRTFQWSRLHWLHPLLWYIIFALALSAINRLKYGKYIVVALVILQLNILLTYSDSQTNIAHSINIMTGHDANIETYKKFYSESLFKKIGDFIGRPKKDYRVISIGMHPAIAQYNGFYTLDGYQNDYPLAYKLSFRRVIEKELAKSEKHKKYFDEWGSRCYAFAAELPRLSYDKDTDIKIRDLELNTKALKEMGGKYVFSAVEIMDHKKTGLTYLRTFEDKASLWKVFLYKVN